MAEITLEYAQALYDSEQYTEAMSACAALLKSETDIGPAAFLGAKSLLYTITTPKDEEKKETFFSLINVACAKANAVEEIQNMEIEMSGVFYDWKAKSIKVLLAGLVVSPTFDNWKNYYPIFPEYIMMNIQMQLYFRNNDLVNHYCSEKGIEKKDYVDEFKDQIPGEVLSDSEIRTLEYETGLTIFADAQARCEADANGNPDFVTKLAEMLINALGVADLAVAHYLPKKEDDPATYCERLKSRAEIQTYELNALLYPNGTPISLIVSDRSKYIEKIKGFYAEICEMDPDFVPPELPDQAGIAPQRQTSSTSGGGCYVATAVYGSYDCPQVWTLRRYRDYTLAETWFGRAFIRAYYAVSPTVVKWFGKADWFRGIWRPKLDKMVERLNHSGVEDTPYNDRPWRF